MRPAIFDNRRGAGLVAALALSAVLLGPGRANAAEPAVAIPPPVVDEPATKPGLETAVLAGGCFWGVQGVFQHVEGVTKAVSGYAGGSADDAVYETVGTGRTGHAESVEITYDPSRVTFGRLLQVYFSVAHNPTQLDYQGPDRGPQYRSTVFAASPEQERIARSYIAQLDEAGLYPGKIVTTLETGKAFYPAEAYHQDFLERNPTYPYIVYNDLPKIENLKKLFPDLYRAEPALVKAATN